MACISAATAAVPVPKLMPEMRRQAEVREVAGLHEEAVVYRRGAQPGDLLCVTGEARRIQLATPPGPRAGFVGGMNPDALDDLFAISQPVPTVKRPNGTDLSDAPLYHVHKWLSGLLDAHEFLHNETALEVAVGIFDWLEPKMTSLIEHHGMTWWDDILQWEYGARQQNPRVQSR